MCERTVKLEDIRKQVANILRDKGDDRMASRVERKFADPFILESMDNHTVEYIADQLL